MCVWPLLLCVGQGICQEEDHGARGRWCRWAVGTGKNREGLLRGEWREAAQEEQAELASVSHSVLPPASRDIHRRG